MRLRSDIDCPNQGRPSPHVIFSIKFGEVAVLVCTREDAKCVREGISFLTTEPKLSAIDSGQ